VNIVTNPIGNSIGEGQLLIVFAYSLPEGIPISKTLFND
jgi:hypothetical protein